MLFRTSPRIIYCNDLNITCAVSSPWDFKVTYIFTQYFNLSSNFYKLYRLSPMGIVEQDPNSHSVSEWVMLEIVKMKCRLYHFEERAFITDIFLMIFSLLSSF